MTSAPSPRPKLTAVVAMAQNRCIGKDNDMPWHLPADLKHFKEVTLGKPVIMGRKTFESIIARLGKPLPGRVSVVLSRKTPMEWASSGSESAKTPWNGVLHATTPEQAIALAGQVPEACIIGGGEIFTLMLPWTDELIVTEIKQDFAGDAFFPAINPAEWIEKQRVPQPVSGNPPVSFDYVTYSRRPAAAMPI
jgi:dihydrofolate reductase